VLHLNKSHTSKSEYLYLIENNFEVKIPSSIGNLSKLIVLQSDSVDGAIPTEIGQCLLLEELTLMGDNMISTIPTEIGLLKYLST
jgi:hypothetical protein